MGIKSDLTGKPPRLLMVELTQLKFFRYSSASAVAVICGQATLWGLTAGLGWRGVPANLGSVAVGSIPNYLINRYWTWQQAGRNRFWTEIVPFWTMAFLGVILSTLAVAYADDRWGTPLAMSIAQLSGFGVLWFGRFLVLDRVMWRVVHDLHPEIDEIDEIDEVDGDGDGREPPAAGHHPAGRASGDGLRGNGRLADDAAHQRTTS